MGKDFYGQHSYGMFLDESEAKRFINSYTSLNKIDEGDIQEWIEDLIYVCDDNYDGRDIFYLNYPRAVHFVNGVFISAEKSGTIFGDPKSVSDDTYADIHDMADEFRDAFSQYLPSDFNYEDHLVEFWGALYEMR